MSETERLLRHIEEQIKKRQFLNAASAAADLQRELLASLSRVLKDQDEDARDEAREREMSRD